MEYPFQIKSLEEYKEPYQKSVENPKNSGRKLRKFFSGERNGIKCLNGILKNQKLNGLKAQN